MATTNFHTPNIMAAIDGVAEWYDLHVVLADRDATTRVHEFIVRDRRMVSFKISEMALEDAIRPVALVDAGLARARGDINRAVIASMSVDDIERAMPVPSTYDQAASYERLATRLMDLVKKSGIPL